MVGLEMKKGESDGGLFWILGERTDRILIRRLGKLENNAYGGI